MKRIVSAFRVLAFCALLPSSALIAQSYLSATGNPSFSVNIPVENGFINIANGNLHLEFSLATMKQRGALQLNERLVYDSHIWTVINTGTASWQPSNVPYTPYSQGGWRFVTGEESGALSYITTPPSKRSCTPPDGVEGQHYYDYRYLNAYTWVDPSGTSHMFDGYWSWWVNTCGDLSASPETVSAWATDGSGYQITLTGDTLDSPSSITINDANGNHVYPGVADRYGNYWSSDSNGNLIDDLGRTPVIVTANGNTTYYDVLAPNGPISNNGTRVRYTVTTAPVQISGTQFGEPGVTEWSGTISPVQSIQLPDGTSYTFAYDGYGELSSVTLPTGGMIQYGWTNYVDSYQNTNRWLTSRTVGSSPAMTFTPSVLTQCTSGGTGCQEQDVLHKPSGDETVYQFTLNNGAWNSNITTYNGSASSGTKLVSVANTYDFSNSCQSACTGSEYITKSIATTTLSDTGAITQTQYTYGSPWLGKLTSLQQWDYYTGTPSITPTRETDYSYSSTGYDLMQTTMYGSNHSQVSQTTNGYTTSATATSGLPQHGTANAGGPYLQTISNWLNTGTSLVTTYAMDDSGMVTSVTDPNGNKTTTTYQCSNALPYIAANALNQTITYGYDCNSGAITSVKDPNDTAAGRPGTVYQYEAVAGRVQSISYPDGGQTSYSYPSATEVDISVLAAPDPTITSQSILDSFGRPYQQVKSGVTSEITYDANGRINCVTNPHLTTSSSTDGTACITTYDGLDRPTLETEQDGNQVTSKYQGNTVISTDEAGNSWQRTNDAFGELTKVLEPVVNEGTIGTASPETDYVYDALSNLLTVTQKGIGSETTRSRSFTYDSLSRLLTSTTPEAGTTTYSYLKNGALCAGDPSLPCSTTDTRNASVNYTYDALNRLIEKQSPGATGVPGFNYTYEYDTANLGTFTASNPIGRLVAASNMVNASVQYSYDPMGRISFQGNTLPSTCCTPGTQNSIQVQYDLAGNATNLTYPDGRVVNQTFNSLGQMLTSTFDNYNGQHVGYSYVTGITYTPAGAQAEIYLGNIAYVHTPYNSREQMCQVWSNGTRGFIDTHIYYGGSTIYCNNTPGNNGNITEIKDWKDSGLTRTFGYDSLNRITSFSTADGSMQQNYSYDSFGNLQNQSGTLNSALTIGSNNQVTNNGFQYDGAGNATQLNNGLGNQTYSYDAENKLLNVNGNVDTYTYDAANNRVRKDFGGDWREYVYFNGQPLAEKNSDGSWSDYIYANGQRIARADNYDVRIHFTGTNCSNCGPQAWAYDIPVPTGYTVQSGDSISWRQYQQGPAVPRGGLALAFSDGTYTNWVAEDQNQQVMNDLTTQNAWVYRSVDLSQYAGKTIVGGWINEDTGSGAGDWQEWFSDIAYFRADGTVQTIFDRQTNVSYPSFGSSGVTNQTFEINIAQHDAWEPLDTTTYYLGDQIGSTRMTLAGGGWPMSSDIFYSFGQEQTASTDPNHYKFATLERDSESGLDHAMFRQYTSTAGRWLSPDPYNGSYDLNNPQSLNRYAYVENSPTGAVDSLGLRCSIYVFGVNDNTGTFDSIGIPSESSAYPYSGLGLLGGLMNAGFGSGGDTQSLTNLLTQYQGEEGGVDLIGFSGGAQTISTVLQNNPSLANNVDSTTYISPGLNLIGGQLYQSSNSAAFKGSGFFDFVATLRARMTGVHLNPTGANGHNFASEYSSAAVQNRLGSFAGSRGACIGGPQTSKTGGGGNGGGPGGEWGIGQIGLWPGENGDDPTPIYGVVWFPYPRPPQPLRGY